jgi:hypothetical protein
MLAMNRLAKSDWQTATGGGTQAVERYWFPRAGDCNREVAKVRIQEPPLPRRRFLARSHCDDVFTPTFLIYGSAIRTPGKRLLYSILRISNRHQCATPRTAPHTGKRAR